MRIVLCFSDTALRNIIPSRIEDDIVILSHEFVQSLEASDPLRRRFGNARIDTEVLGSAAQPVDGPICSLRSLQLIEDRRSCLEIHIVRRSVLHTVPNDELFPVPDNPRSGISGNPPHSGGRVLDCQRLRLQLVVTADDTSRCSIQPDESCSRKRHRTVGWSRSRIEMPPRRRCCFF